MARSQSHARKPHPNRPDVAAPRGPRPISLRAGHFVLAEIERNEALPALVTGAQAFAGVMCTLSVWLGNDAAAKVANGMPRGLRPLVERCNVHRDGRPRPADAPAFIARVAQHLDVDETRAEEITRVVFHAVHRLMTIAELDAVARELPEDLRTVWLAATKRGAPGEKSRID
jgi:uncharacterized protein (DUF2267 family)